MKAAHWIANTSGLYQIQKVDKLLYMFVYVFFLFYFAGGTEREVFLKALHVYKNGADS